jgi:hypothetical protein
MNKTTTISTAIRESSRRALKGLAFSLSVLVYLAGLLYGGVRSYTLFSATIDPSLLALALLGIIALEISALALPLAIHFWVAPGAQRMAAYIFYGTDLSLIVGNAVLDAAHHSGTLLPSFLQGYGTFALPGLPVICMAGWALLWLLDPASREHDMIATVRSATQESLMAQIQKAADSVDITQAVEAAAVEAAHALVTETLGQAPRMAQEPITVQPVPPKQLSPIRLNATAIPAPTLKAGGDGKDNGTAVPKG